jgi:hypothetical protein
VGLPAQGPADRLQAGLDEAPAAPFKRNDAMLAVMPIGVIVFPGTGIQANVAWKAAQLGIPVWRFDGGA